MGVWTAATNKAQTTPVTAGPTSSAPITLTATPAAHSLLMCVVVWTGAVTVTVSGGTGNTWVSTPSIDSGTGHCQFWYVLDSAAVATTITAAFSANATNIQLLGAEFPLDVTKVAITAASFASSTSITTYTCTISEGRNLAVGDTIAITGMAHTGNNTGGSNPAAFALQTTNGTTSFTVYNPNGFTATENGTGLTSTLQGSLVVTVDTDVHTSTGTSTTPNSGAISAAYGGGLAICYADNNAGTAIAWGNGTGFSLGSTNNSRGAWEYALNAELAVPVTPAFTTASITWECGAIFFNVTSTGSGVLIPTGEQNAVQGPLLVTPRTRFGGSTDPYGAGPSGAGSGKLGNRQIGIGASKIGKWHR